jgi:hypothetical protein
MSSKIITTTVALGLVLSGCASQANQQLLASYQDACSRYGTPSDCHAALEQEAINKDEAKSNALKIVGALLLIPLVAVAAAAQAREDQGPQCYNAWHHYWYYC